jgi:hypothetical protein
VLRHPSQPRGAAGPPLPPRGGTEAQAIVKENSDEPLRMTRTRMPAPTHTDAHTHTHAHLHTHGSHALALVGEVARTRARLSARPSRPVLRAVKNAVPWRGRPPLPPPRGGTEAQAVVNRNSDEPPALGALTHAHAHTHIGWIL